MRMLWIKVEHLVYVHAGSDLPCSD